MIGRTHGVHAEPMTLGLKLALWYAELAARSRRMERTRGHLCVGKMSVRWGPSSSRSERRGGGLRRLGCARAGLIAGLQRDRHAELVATLAIFAAALEKFALEIRGLQKTEVGEVEEPFGKGRRARRPCPTSGTPSAASRLAGSPACCAGTRWRPSRTSRSGTNGTSRIRRWSA